ncbi:MAG: CRISPR-associated helicase Cas3' [Nitrospirae bacterium]|nr:CRISPR-associated helicase Cas3' [Nitrospirota bacterium]
MGTSESRKACNEPIAHMTEDGREHGLYEHLFSTAKRAAEFAAEFWCGEWGYLAGLWHDLGKYSQAFQRKIHAAAVYGVEAHIEAKARVDHSTAGALYSIERFDRPGRILAYLLAGHHAGLTDWHAEHAGLKALSQRLLNASLLGDARQGKIPDEILNYPMPSQKPKSGSDPAFWMRMLFSCLVDADFLDTESFFEPDKSELRGKYPTVVELLRLFTDYMHKKSKDAKDTPVNRVRSKVLERCIVMAANPSGIFTLTVPTGGGKTLSSMSFALNHAVTNNKNRIIYVIPYTSIIEQSADQFRQILGNAIIEHHSNLDVEDESLETAKSRLACENWDAPIIVTTSVQFFESLFASRTSRCRKLHNIVNSVVILDEAQLLPPDFLRPSLHALKELVKFYGITLLLCTATQPALGKRDGFNEGLENLTEIIDDPMALHDSLKRVNIHMPENLNEPCTWEALAQELIGHKSILCIVNRRDDARLLWTQMPEGTVHLSALMCGAHRSKVVREIKERLAENVPMRVISTQLVEAGVDIDFPVVYRALAGLDSIAQAAGRCNREGLQGRGNVHVFVPPKQSPPGILRQTADIGRRLLMSKDGDPIAPARFEEFFRELYWLRGDQLDSKGILRDLASDPELRFSFRTAAQKFRLIDETIQESVVVRYDEGEKYVDMLERIGPERWLMRKLQRYVINLPRYLHMRLLASGAIQQCYPGIFIQNHPSLYDESLGFCPDRSIIYEPDDLIT